MQAIQLQHFYIAVFSGTASLSLVLAWVMWKQREAFSATSVVALMLAVALWCAAEAAIWWVPTLQAQSLMIKVTYLGVSVVVAAFSVFTLQIAGFGSWLTRRRVIYICLPPALLCVMAMTNPGGLVETSYVAESLGSYTHYVVRYGPLLRVFMGTSALILTASLGLLVWTVARSSGVKRAQATLVLIGSLIPLLVAAANQASSTPVEGLEAASFFATGIFYVFAVARGTLLDASGQLVTAGALAKAGAATDMLGTANVFLADELEEAQLRERALYDEATRDALTGLYNRRAMNEYLARDMGRSARTGEPVALLMIDVDWLKQINDTLSHAAGDKALVSVAEQLLLGARAIDVVCRFGGDEFVVIMSGADAETANQRAQELRERVDGLTVAENGQTIAISVSIGVAASSAAGSDPVAIMKAADDALYAAKEAGRNRVEVV